jgi:ABC-type oligopeptide transport system ATPase subunit
LKEVLLEVKNLKKYFPVTAGILRHQVGAVKAVDGIDFTVYSGKVLGMVGESGCGKSTAARAAIRLIEPTDGEITFLGQNLRSLNEKQLQQVRRNAQMVFQDPFSSLNPRLSVGESIGEGLLYHGLVSNRKEQREYVAEIIRRIGMSPEVMDRYPHQFSGGQQQRLCIGRAIAMNPKFIICDEALSALDVSVQAQILNLLVELKDTLGLSYLFISHDLSIIRHISDWVVVMYFGKIVESASTEQLFNNPQHPYTKALLSAIPSRVPKRKLAADERR